MVEQPGMLTVLRGWWWLIAAGAVMAALAGWAIASQATKVYEADAQLLVGPLNADYDTLQAAGGVGRTYAALSQDPQIVRQAARSAGVTLSEQKAADAVKASANDVTRIVDLRVRNSDAHAAARIAAALAARLIALQRSGPLQQTAPDRAVAGEPELRALTPKQQDGVAQALRRVLGRSTAAELRVVAAPTAPRAPVSPRVGLLVLLAALVGALAAAVFAIVRDGGVPRERDFEDDSFGLDSFLRSADGDEPGGTGAVERWMERPGTGSS